MTQSNTRLTLDVDEVGRMLGISRNAAYVAAKNGDIPSIRIGKRIVVPKEAFDRFLENASNKSNGLVKE